MIVWIRVFIFAKCENN